MMRVRLMSPIEAAGYAMAPSEEDMAYDEACETYLSDWAHEQPEHALRNGHASAARVTQRHLVPFKRPAVFADPGWAHWLRDICSGWWIGRAAA
jgi:hypothetical protein